MVTYIASNLKVYKINIIDCKKFRSRKVLVILTHCFSVVLVEVCPEYILQNRRS